MSAMGLGCAGIGGPFLIKNGSVNGYGQVNDKNSIEAIRVALDMGITYYDTADIYGCGRSERVLGEALGSSKWELGKTLCLSAPAMKDNLAMLITIDAKQNISHETIELK